MDKRPKKMNEFIYYCSLLYHFLGKRHFVFLFKDVSKKFTLRQGQATNWPQGKEIGRFYTLRAYILLRKKYQIGGASGNEKIVKK
ncbi:hypothetical protein [Trichothermofontia sp.]